MQITANSPASAHLLDVTRTVSRAGMCATGIDRIERAYIEHLAQDPAPLFGLVRTRLGYLLLDKGGCTELLSHCEAPLWTTTDLISRITRRGNTARARTESGLRKTALDRATPSRLGKMLKRHLSRGTVYLNTGQTNFNDRTIHALRDCDGVRIGVYLHDTIPLDLPDTQTQKSRLAFRQLFARVDRNADLVICNSHDTKARILGHAKHLNAERVHVIWPGLPKITIGTAPDGPWSGHPYFIAIGTIEPRKNIGFLLDLWGAFTGPDDPHLILCGRRGWMNEEVFARLDRHPTNVHEISNLADEAMWALLKNSDGLLFPSLAEGFGYPAIEAVHLKVPLICNPLPVFKEVLGDYPIYASESERYVWRNNIEQLTQRRRGESGEQKNTESLAALTWQAHFNQLFTVL